jgi:DNA gyrase subunit A
MDSTERIEFNEKIVPREIVEEMEESYLDYAMSVIVGRAIPDVTDGLKAIHRRIIYAMADGGYTSDKQTNKSARIVGEVMGKYHPHGEMAIYDALVRMAQPWNMRYPLIEGQGNFGSNDGDAAAAMRYTEVRLRPIAEYLVGDIKKETAEFVPTFDAKTLEPLLLPAGLPLLLMNGTEGIAVGVATRIPPHNLRELSGALKHLIANPDSPVDELMQFVTGPDFPSGGFIIGAEGIRNAYRTGRGSIMIRGRAEIEQDRRDRFRIVITEVPYQVNKAALVERIAGLVTGKKLQGISDIRDESDRTGSRVVIELKRDANPQVILNNLYKSTPLQITYGVIMLALRNGAPRVMDLKLILAEFIVYRRDVVTKRTRYELKVAQEREHILEGLKIALDRLDEIVDAIRSSKNREAASLRLREEFELSEAQAKAILDMRLAQLTGLERQKVLDELKGLKVRIKELTAILADPKKVDEVIVTELDEAVEKFGDQRRTVILRDADGADIDEEDLVKDEPVVVSLTANGYVKRVPLSTYRVQGRGGRGLIGQTMKTDDVVRGMLTTSTLNTILSFTDRGNVYSLRVFRIPSFERTAKGTPIINLIGITAGETVTALVSLEDFSRPCLFMCTRLGIVKKVELTAFASLRVTGKRAIHLDDKDSLDFVQPTTGDDEIIISTRKGLAVRFNESEVRTMGTSARGVKGVRLSGDDDAVIGMNIVQPERELLVVSELGFGKRTDLAEFRQTHRGTKGIICMRVKEKTGPVVSAHTVGEEDEFLVITLHGMLIRSEVKQVSQQGRATQGVRVINLKPEDAVSSVEVIHSGEKDEPLFE